MLATLAVLFVSYFRRPVSLWCAGALLGWYVLAQIGYTYGEIEEKSTQINGIIFCVTCLWLTRKFHNDWLPWSLMVCCAFTMTFTALYTGTDAYLFKTVKNSVYIVKLLLVVGSWRG